MVIKGRMSGNSLKNGWRLGLQPAVCTCALVLRCISRPDGHDCQPALKRYCEVLIFTAHARYHLSAMHHPCSPGPEA